MNRRALILRLVAGLVLGCGIAVIAARQFAAHPAVVAEPRAAPNVPLVRAIFGTYQSRVRALGRVGPPAGGDVKLAFADSGIVSRIDVHVGQIVAAGEPVAEVDAGGLLLDAEQARSEAVAAAANFGGGTVPGRALSGAAARLATARDKLNALENGTGSAQSEQVAALAGVRQSEAKLGTDQRGLDREAALYAGGVAALKDVQGARAQLDVDRAEADANRAKAVSSGSDVGASLTQARADVAQAESDVRAAQAQIVVTGAQAKAAQARYESARRLVATSTLRAPAAGVVMAVFKHPGEAVDPTQAVMSVGPASSRVVTLAMSGDDARRVRLGDRAAIQLTGRSGGGIGHVLSVVPSVDPSTQMSTVVLGGIPSGALSGDAVEATIEVDERQGVIIPTGAVVEDPQTGRAIVFVRSRAPDGTDIFVARRITIASGDETDTLVASGLRGGEWIAAQGAYDLLAPSGGG